MYRFLGAITAEDVGTIAAFAFMEMLERGFTAVGEFHYLHHQPDGTPYANPAAHAERIASAASDTGIAMTLLPVFYAHGGFGGQAPNAGQRRFLSDLESFGHLMEASARAIAGLPHGVLGFAPHSLRAATPEELDRLVSRPTQQSGAYPCRRADEGSAGLPGLERKAAGGVVAREPAVNERWCLIHATHLTPEETQALARSVCCRGPVPHHRGQSGDGVFRAWISLRPAGALASARIRMSRSRHPVNCACWSTASASRGACATP